MRPCRMQYGCFHALLCCGVLALGTAVTCGQQKSAPPAKFGVPSTAETSGSGTAEQGRSLPVALAEPADPSETPLPINLATALTLGHARALDIAIAAARVRVAAAQLKQANVLWLPSLQLGADYFVHEGRNQDATTLEVFDNRRNTLLFGGAPIMVFGVTDAIFRPLVARQELQSRQALLRAANNDIFQSVAEAYFNVQQARGDVAASEDARRRAAQIVKAAEQLAPGLVPTLEINRARAEVARQEQILQAAAERRRVANIELLRLLHMVNPGVDVTVRPLEPPHLQITLVWPHLGLDDLVPIALTTRPELASQQAQVQAALQRWRQERARPLLPSVLLRGGSTSPGPAGTFALGEYGAGPTGNITSFAGRLDLDLQVIWQLDNLGFGYVAKVAERRSEQEAAELELVRWQDRVVAEVARAQAQVRFALARIASSERELRQAYESAEKNFLAMKEPRQVGNLTVLVVRPQEALVSVQALQIAYTDYFVNVANYNRAQFSLYRALGNPANYPFLGPDPDQAYRPAESGMPQPARAPQPPK